MVLFNKIIQRIHLWVGLLLGIQVSLWMLSGVFMSWFHIDLVRGDTNAFITPPPELEASAYASPGGVIAQVDGATSLELRSFMNRPVYEITSADGVALFDASTGQKLSPISEDTARAVAKQDYVGEGKIVKIALMSETPYEYRKEKPVWRVDFNDNLHTRIYVSPSTGEVASRRNDVWRIFDFLWMLHIMDYGERTDFNNPLLKAASATGLLFAISGLIMVVMKKGRNQIARDIGFITRRRRKQAPK
ncbi:MAG: PepSY domain-containing protein [Alphaproteobacteria bacterium]|nr:PepSY domain-containing protein [Alphaproteobacteria bacterium]